LRLRNSFNYGTFLASIAKLTIVIMKTHAHALTIGNQNIGHYYWIGHFPDGMQYYAGQSFKTSVSGKLKNICLYPEMILGEGDASVALYEFEESTHSWKEKLVEKHLSIDKKMQRQWIKFSMDNVQLDPKRQYAFKVDCNHSSMMAIAENNWGEQDPYPDGEQWTGSSKNTEGRFHRHFDLAFMAEIEV